MELNLSREVTDTILNALRASKTSLKRQQKTAEGNKLEIITHQLEEVEYALYVLTEGYGL